MANGRDYSLFLREGTGRLFLRLRDCGITLAAGTIAWQADGASRDKPYGDVRDVNLGLARLPDEGRIGNCRITFADGLVLHVSSATGRGGAGDAERNRDYAAFVSDLHTRLAARPHADIAFVSGLSETAHRVQAVALAAGLLLFVALPVALMLMTGDPKTLFLAVAGAAFVVPLWRMREANRPRHYDPAQWPRDLMP